ncbi:f518929b-f385-4bd4-b0fe-afe183371d52 [Sclerotinia trifoliorum]|uniref:F518929b-f385-4bd4-b0fe-afe183371d52 n=1 Tax=Sclerotinia trifoliorum TaxID=28548 RepID=A0A8H2VZJ5_9HELO|nr:f518929b-f385-4bd4-b0fe-afe183371d52 [Sclerotinia trifoliorum]
MTLHNDASKKAKEAEEKAKKAAEESDKKLERLLRRNRYKSERDEKKHRIKNKNPENPYAPGRRDDEESIVTDSDFVGNYRDRNQVDDEPPLEKIPRVSHRHREYVRAGSVRSDDSYSECSNSSMGSVCAPSVRKIYDKGSGRHRRYYGHGHGYGHHSSDSSSDMGRPPSVYNHPPPHYGGFRYG